MPRDLDDAAAALAALLERHGDRVAKRWAGIYLAEPGGCADHPARDLQRRYGELLAELGRVLASRGADGPRLWGEIVRHEGGARFEARCGIGDVVRELAALRAAAAEVWTDKQRAPLAAAQTDLLAEIVTRATAAAVDDYVRRLRIGRARLQEQAAIESIVGHLLEGLVAVELDGSISYATPPAARVLGVSEGELAGLGREELADLVRRLGIRDERQRPLAADDLPFLQALRTRRPVAGRWLRVRRPADGEERVVEADAIPIFDDEELRGAVGTLRDRTDEYRQREALTHAYAELRRLHVRLLHRARAHALGELAANVAGALNNTMNAIRLHVGLAEGDEAERREHLRGIAAAVDEMSRVVTNLQQLAAPRRAEPEPVALDEAVREALELAQPELAASVAGRELRLELELHAGDAHVLAPPADVREIAVHLLLNALETSGEGTIHVTTRAQGDRVELAVAGAAGLGEATPLEVVRELSGPLGGRVEVRPRNGAAAEVVVALPRTAAPAPEARPAPAPPPRAAAERADAVLVVDDDADQRELLATVLEARGIAVRQAATAAEAEADARERPFDVALVDLAMPDKSGWEIVSALRRIRPGARTALVTGYEPTGGSEPERQVDAVFRKPVNVAELLEFLGRS